MSDTKKRNKTVNKEQKNRKSNGSDNQFMRAEVAIIITFAISVFLFLSNFGICGFIGDFFRGIQLGVFGVMGYLAPLILLVGTCFFFSNRGSILAMVKLVSMVVFLISLCAFFHLLVNGRYVEGGVIQLYKNANGGGLIGGLIGMLLTSILGIVGAYLVLVVLVILSIVGITEKSVVNLVKKGSGKAYVHARENVAKKKVIYDEKREQRKQEKREEKVRGVNLKATNLPKEQQGQVDLEEVPLSVDIFTGNIDLPKGYEEEESIWPDPKEARVESVGDTPWVEEPVREHLTMKEEAKQVITASGKIIDTDTEALQKKLEQRREEVKKEQDGVTPVQPVMKKEYIFPPLSLLNKGNRSSMGVSQESYKETAIKLQQTLKNFGVGVTVTNVSCGPAVTRYELQPEQGVKVSRIVSLADDIKLSLAAADIRIEAPIPGKSAVGIEVPNKENSMVYFRELLEAEDFRNHPSKIAFSVGKDIGGQVVVTDIAKMPHLLIAGSTGSGKSVCINTLIMSILYKASPEDVKLIMVDPKVVELSVYNGIPHLLIPVVTDPKKASGALNWAVAEMTDRYKKFADYNVRDLKGYNEKIKNIENIEDENKPQKLPQIVIIVDELADLMMVAPGEVEDSICRLAQLARAAGIHLVIATQRPSVNVITGLIKANVPSRIAFAVSSGVDSRTIIDMNGAEKLLGKGDMLFYPSGVPKPQRVQGAFISDQEVLKVVEFLSSQQVTSGYQPDVENQLNNQALSQPSNSQDDLDEYFVQAARFIIEKEKGSIGMLQRMFKIGFNRAARIMDQLSEAGVVGEEEGTKPRKVLMTIEEFEEMIGR